MKLARALGVTQKTAYSTEDAHEQAVKRAKSIVERTNCRKQRAVSLVIEPTISIKGSKTPSVPTVRRNGSVR